MLTLLFVLLWSPATPLGTRQDGPPGLLFVEGGKTRVGSTRREIEDLILEREELAFALAGETPQFTLQVDDFYLMPTEVTNEQYAQFVRATGDQPPRSWGTRALQAGQAAFLEEQGKQKLAARAAGVAFEPAIFDAEAWWDQHWRSVEWEVPPDASSQPVVFVTHADAERYARWAGLRLMTEFEFQRAARGDSARIYPWGDAWDDKRYCQSLHAGKDLPAPVGSFPAGATRGFHDLAGNVWEWTSSPFEAYPGYAALSFTRGKRTIESLAPFDPEQRVIVSGSFHTDRVGVRIGTRRYSDRTQSTNALGFRCAASPKPGLDAARALMEHELRPSVLADVRLADVRLADVRFAPEQVVTRRHWTTVPGRVDLPGYAVISGYEQVLFCPRVDLPASTAEALASLSLESGPVFLGFIDLAHPSAQPALDAGTYFVAWRGAGELNKANTAPDPRTGPRELATGQWAVPFHAVPGFSTATACYLFYSSEGKPLSAMEAPSPRIERMGVGSLRLESSRAPAAEGASPPVPSDTLRFTVPITSSISRSKGLVFELPIRVEPGLLDSSWD